MTDNVCFAIFVLSLLVMFYCLLRLLNISEAKTSRKALEDKAVERAKDKLLEDFENLRTWVEAAEKLKVELELLAEQNRDALEQIKRNRYSKRDSLGRFTKKG